MLFGLVNIFCHVTLCLEVCGERSENIEQHKAAAGHYKCHVSSDCAAVVFATAGELSSHQHIVHGLSTAPQPSLQQLQQQVAQLPIDKLRKSSLGRNFFKIADWFDESFNSKLFKVAAISPCVAMPSPRKACLFPHCVL